MHGRIQSRIDRRAVDTGFYGIQPSLTEGAESVSVARQVKGYGHHQFPALDHGPKVEGIVKKLALSGRIPKDDFLPLDGRRHQPVQSRLLFRRQSFEGSHPAQLAQYQSVFGQFLDFFLIVGDLLFESQSHQFAGNVIDLGLDFVNDGIFDQGFHGRVFWFGAVAGFRRFGFQSIQDFSGVAGQIPQLFFLFAQIFGRCPQTPDEIPEPGQCLGMPAGGSQQDGTIRRCFLKPAGQLQEGGDADGLVGTRRQPRYINRTVVKGFDENQLFLKMGIFSGNEAIDIFSGNLFPSGFGIQTDFREDSAVRHGFKISETAAGFFQSHPKTGEMDGGQLLFVLEQSP